MMMRLRSNIKNIKKMVRFHHQRWHWVVGVVVVLTLLTMTLAIQSTSETVKEEIEIAEAKMTTDEPLNVVVIAGSVRSGRHGIKLAKFIVSEVERRGHNVTLVDPLDYKEYGLFEKRWLDYENDDENDAPEWLVGLQKIFDEADAYIPISPEYNHGLSPALINIMNLFIKEYKHKTSAIATYSGGSFAGLRAGNAMKAV
eukprot:TRINITY_DN3252_c0_g2_i1.p1 TRINITY_DN3252_c0_g2~~TRINITY_DN3252_c0_g2_i1.p1  ORF type:complete len:199 (-),score=46.66 TRINITY_DN3252_c0_g2_i1:296-892(-)